MTSRKLRWLGLGLVATAGAGVLGLSAMLNPTVAYADDSDIGLVIGGSALPIPGPTYVGAADGLYLNNPITQLYPDLTFYQATRPTPLGTGCSHPRVLIRCSAAASTNWFTTTHSIPMAFRPLTHR